MDDEVNMLTHSYPHKTLSKIKVPSDQVDDTFNFWPAVCSGDLQVKKSMVIPGTECRY